VVILVTGGAGFIGANFVFDLLAAIDEALSNFYELNYAGNPQTLCSMQGYAPQQIVKGDISDNALVSSLLVKRWPPAVFNFEAGSLVVNSIHGRGDVIQNNVVGTFNMLKALRGFGGALPEAEKSALRFLHVPTNEVRCSLAKGDPAFTETQRYEPNSPYSASKGASDHQVRALSTLSGFPNNTKGVRYDRS
jgi:dTDP-glucose 4,6-dehydratase